MKLLPYRLFGGLAGRVAGTLALALLPIGGIAVFQAFEISREAARNTETALMNATAEAAAGEALAVASAAGTAGTLAAHGAVVVDSFESSRGGRVQSARTFISKRETLCGTGG